MPEEQKIQEGEFREVDNSPKQEKVNEEINQPSINISEETRKKMVEAKMYHEEKMRLLKKEFTLKYNTVVDAEVLPLQSNSEIIYKSIIRFRPLEQREREGLMKDIGNGTL